jgi:hypothetical protein
VKGCKGNRDESGLPPLVAVHCQRVLRAFVKKEHAGVKRAALVDSICSEKSGREEDTGD